MIKATQSLDLNLSQLLVILCLLFLVDNPKVFVSANNTLVQNETRHLVSYKDVQIPDKEDVMTDLDLPEGTVTIVVETAPRDLLYVLARRTPESDYIPVGRSYAENDWEAAPGLHHDLPISCDGIDRFCELKLSISKGDVYFITKYSNDVSDKAKVARFLGRATFGPTLAEINAFDTTNEIQSMAEYVRDQIAQPIGSHREFYRKRLNPRRTETERHGTSGPKPCEWSSRWRRFAFTSQDARMFRAFTMELETKTVNGITAYVLSFAGFPRTVLYEPLQYRQGNNLRNVPDGSYRIMRAEDILGSKRPSNVPASFILRINGTNRIIVGGNPEVNLDRRFVNAGNYHELDLSDKMMKGLDLEYSKASSFMLQQNHISDTCDVIADPEDSTHKTFRNDCRGESCDHYLDNGWRNPTKTVFGIHPKGFYMLYDQRLDLDENTIERPMIDGGGKKVLNSLFVAPTSVYRSDDPRPAYYCANVPQNIFNEEGCRLSFDPNVCAPRQNEVMTAITLDTDSLIQMFQLTKRYVYSIQGAMRFDETIHPDTNMDPSVPSVALPCELRKRSRWLRLKEDSFGNWIRLDGSSAACTNTLTSFTSTELESAISSTADANPYMKDVYFRGSCSDVDRSKHGMLIYVAEEQQCYENVHPDYMSVYDVSNWAKGGEDSTILHHPGGPAAIRQFKTTGVLLYPTSHEMWRWQKHSVMKGRFGEYVGRLGDTIEFQDLPDQLQTNAIADSLGASQYVVGDAGGTLICGSVGEVAPDPKLDDYFEIGTDDDDLPYKAVGQHKEQKKNVWVHQALYASDQLRQKMAWALSQILVVSPSDVTDNRFNEAFIVYYDIFVRNGLGNYRDVLREVSYSVKMGEMLTYLGNAAIGYNWHRRRQIRYPDENYAREIMQLFTIGLDKLNVDGTPLIDKDGSPIKTYDSKDIMSFARVWTGFQTHQLRGNVEDMSRRRSNIDPMSISNIQLRDLFPKRGLDDKYLGDRYPLCEDMPKTAFLTRGAKFKLLGGDAKPRWQWHVGVDLSDRDEKHFVLDSTSELYTKLKCKEVNGGCDYATVIVLDEDLNCSGIECNVDTIRTVKVDEVFYEYIRMPCVTLSFYNDAKKLSAGLNNNLNMCGNPKLESATEACCGLGLETNQAVLDRPRHADRPCVYLGEKVTYETNANRCYDLGGYPCDHVGFFQEWMGNAEANLECMKGIQSNLQNFWNNEWSWTTAPCSIQLAIQRDGLVAIHHQPDQSGHNNPPPTAPHVNVDESLNYFSVHWERNVANDEVYPSTDNGCGNGACQVYNDELCLCDTFVTETIGFSSLPNRAQILSNLSIGAVSPSVLNHGVSESNRYQLVQSANGVEVWSRKNQPEFGTETIFKLLDERNEYVFLKNVISNVLVGSDPQGEAALYTIRNPPTFHDLSEHAVRDAYFETDAVIDHLLHHNNTPPFIAKSLIKHFDISNPSPRYVEAVATAFQTGSYSISGLTYGEGRWGDLAATAAAILLDREATTAVLDADPFHGSLRAPFDKVIGFIRSMELKRADYSKNRSPFLQPGILSQIGQVPYEAPTVFSFFSPFYQPPGNFAKADLVAPESEVLYMGTILGIMNGLNVLVKDGLVPCNGGLGYNYPCSVPMGYLDYKPSSDSITLVIDELDLLLTHGRLSERNKNLILRRYQETLATDPQNAVKIAQQLMLATPEFHSTNKVRLTGAAREGSDASSSNGKPYKAVINLFLSGGMDSFYMLSPWRECVIYDEYSQLRGNEASLADDEMLRLDAIDSNQPCDRFGLHQNLSVLKSLYDTKRGIFFANIGHLDKPVTKENYFVETNAQLFSHSDMQKEAGFVDAFRENVGTGVLGRMLDVLQGQGYSVSSIAVDQYGVILEGDSSLNRPVDVVKGSGIDLFYDGSGSPSSSQSSESMKNDFKTLNGEVQPNSGQFAELWSHNFFAGVDKASELQNVIAGVTLEYEGLFTGNLGDAFKMVAKLIRSQEARDVDRDAFYISYGGFDHHQNLKTSLDPRFETINGALDAFTQEMSAAGMIDQVTLVVTSEFARTLTPNSSQGTDHAWGGNYFMMSGNLKGGQILGEYPQSFNTDDPTNIGRGRLIPTTSWESIWNGVAQWFGITSEEDLDYVLPNRANFGCRLLSEKDLFNDGTNGNLGCGGETMQFSQPLQLSEPRYLNGEEQKRFCKLIISIAQLEDSEATFRCVIVHQMLDDKALSIKAFDDSDKCPVLLTITTELSTDATGISESVSARINGSSDLIMDSIAEGDLVKGICGLGQTTVKTNAPTILDPSSPTRAPTYSKPTGPYAPVGFDLVDDYSGATLVPCSFFWTTLLFLASYLYIL